VCKTDSKPSLPVAAKKCWIRTLSTDQPNQRLADILHSDQRGLALLAGSRPFTRKVVGWAMSDHMSANYTTLRLPWQSNGSAREQACIHNSDRGSRTPRRLPRHRQAAAIIQSMSRKGNSWDMRQ